MTLHECTKLLARLAVTLRAELDEPDFRAYHRALDDVPVELLAAACQLAAQAPRGKFEPRFPTAPKLREFAERARQQASGSKKWEPCDECQHGWVLSPHADGRVTRCACWRAHQARITAGGLSTPLALPAPEEVEA